MCFLLAHAFSLFSEALYGSETVQMLVFKGFSSFVTISSAFRREFHERGGNFVNGTYS
ncbi:MAG: hypothetical protein HDR35_05095 [Treponema sp.]|nr:hypothetical protein [Treponema sp.]